MNRKRSRHCDGFLVVAVVAFTFSFVMPVEAQNFSSGSTGVDGPFNPTCAPTPCTVTVPLPSTGVFNYTTVTIPAGVTVKFARNQGNTPVTILASGDVIIAGIIDVRGTSPNGSLAGRGGPGGFDGGLGGTAFQASLSGSPGLGPGGGLGGAPGVGASNPGSGSGAGYGSAGSGQTGVSGGGTYGVHTLLPWLGGSGGGGGIGGSNNSGPAGGGGGGALLIASSGTIRHNGALIAVGGGLTFYDIDGARVSSGSGAGGGVRLVANTISASGGTGSIDVNGGYTSGYPFAGGPGRVRLEGFQIDNLAISGSVPSKGIPGPVVPGTNFPSVKIVSIGGVTVPASTQGSFFFAPDTTLNPNTPNPISVNLQAANVPVGTVIAVSVVTEGVATRSTFNSPMLAGTFASSTATASVTLPPGTSVLTATATFATAP